VRVYRAFALVGFAIAAALIMAAPASAENDEDVYRRSEIVVFGDIVGLAPDIVAPAIEWLIERENTDIAPTLILAMRFNRPATKILSDQLVELTGHRDAKTWFDWMLWQEAHPEIVPHPSFARIKTEIMSKIDPGFSRFLPLSDDARIRLEEVAWGGVGVEGIPALNEPELIGADAADYLIPGELVFGVEINGDARAYPLRIMDWHEMLNDTVGGVPVSLAYCTLCGSGILFDGRVEGYGLPFRFATSGLLYRSNKLMFDKQTDSLWNQFTGQPVSGRLAASGIELTVLPLVITSWRDWKARHPKTKVLSLETGHVRDYTPGAPYSRYFDSPDLMFPALAKDDKRAIKDFVFGVRTTGGAKAWPIADFADKPVINDAVGFADVVIIGNSITRSARAYRRDGREFAAGKSADELISGTEIWRITETALIGPDGEKLPRMAGHVAYWFAWSSFIGSELP
jgi:uncharacterized protein DUF3179